jgi:hypothetical protein
MKSTAFVVFIVKIAITLLSEYGIVRNNSEVNIPLKKFPDSILIHVKNFSQI